MFRTNSGLVSEEALDRWSRFFFAACATGNFRILNLIKCRRLQFVDRA